MLNLEVVKKKSKKITGIKKEVVLRNTEGSNDKTGKEVVGNICTKTSWFLRRIFQNKLNKDSQINEKNVDSNLGAGG